MVDFVTAEKKCENFAIGTYLRNHGKNKEIYIYMGVINCFKLFSHW